MPPTQEKIADVLGITPVHVNRVLKELRDRNLLHLRSRRVAVPDIGRLRAFRDFSPDYLHLTGGSEDGGTEAR